MSNKIISVTRGGAKKYAVMSGELLLVRGTRAMLFDSMESACAAGNINNMVIAEEDEYDLDLLESSMEDGDAFADDVFLLKYWDFFSRLALSVGSTFAGGGRSFVINDIYEKLYTTVYGGSADERFFIDDTEEELIRGVLGEGIRIFEKNTATF